MNEFSDLAKALYDQKISPLKGGDIFTLVFGVDGIESVINGD